MIKKYLEYSEATKVTHKKDVKPILQYLGENLEEMDIKLNFHSNFCIPETEIKKQKFE